MDSICIDLSIRCAAIGSLISGAETIVSHKDLKKNSLLTWEASRLRHPLFISRHFAKIADPLFSYPTVLVIPFSLLVGGIGLFLVGTNAPWWPTIAILVLLANVLFGIRNPLGQDGADQMLIQVLSCNILYSFATSNVAKEVVLFYLCFQVSLAYVTSGVAKLSSSSWKDGSALQRIVRTQTYGTPKVGMLLMKNSWLARILSIAVITFEISFPISLLIPKVAFGYMVVGLMFHTANAVIMGLNGFFFAFLAAYPVLLVVSGRLTNH